MKLAAFYHCWCPGNWQEPTREFLDALAAGGFPGPLFVGLVGSAEQRAEALGWIRDRHPAEVAAEAEAGWEQVTLRAVREYAQRAAGAVGYFHSKGASHRDSGWNPQQRRLLLDRLVRCWHDAVEVLSDEPVVRASLNFWWARCEWVRQLDRCCECDRGEAEAWVGGYTLHTPYEERPRPDPLDGPTVAAMLQLERARGCRLRIGDVPREDYRARRLLASGRVDDLGLVAGDRVPVLA